MVENRNASCKGNKRQYYNKGTNYAADRRIFDPPLQMVYGQS